MNADLFDKFSILLQRNHKYMNTLLESFSGKTELSASSLICLKTLGKSEDGKTLGELCEICCYDKALISRNIKALREKGYIRYNEEDIGLKRGYRLVLTTKGMELTENIQNNLHHFAQEIIHDISEDDVRKFYDISAKFSENLGRLVRNMDGEGFVPTQNM